MRFFCKFLLYFALIWIIYCLESSLSLTARPFGVKIDILPAVLGCISVMESIYPAAFTALWAGFLCDAASFSGVFFMLSYFFLSALLSRISTRYFYPKAAICAAAGMIMLWVPRLMRVCTLYFAFPGVCLGYFTVSLCVLTFFGAAMFFPVFLICRAIHRIAPRRSRALPVYIPTLRIKRTALDMEGSYAAKK